MMMSGSGSDDEFEFDDSDSDNGSIAAEDDEWVDNGSGKAMRLSTLRHEQRAERQRKRDARAARRRHEQQRERQRLVSHSTCGARTQ